ncbi:MAG: phosphodiester glycosidase family protein [Bacteroidota bacterium]
MNTWKGTICFLSLLTMSACLTPEKVKEHHTYKELKNDKNKRINALRKEINTQNKRIKNLEEANISLSDLLDSLENNDNQRIAESKVSSSKPSYIGKETEKYLDANGNQSYRVYVKGKVFTTYLIKHPGDIKLFWKNKNRRITNLEGLKRMASKDSEELIFGMNAGIFTQGGRPEGLFVVAGKEQVPLNTRQGTGNFYLEPNGVFFITERDSAAVLKTASFAAIQSDLKIKYATQSGPMLVINNKVHPVFKEDSKHYNIRNGVGVKADGSLVFLISEKPVTLYQFARIFKDHFKCPNALYLDGAISKAYLPKLDKNRGLTGNFGPLIGVYKNKAQKNSPNKSK